MKITSTTISLFAALFPIVKACIGMPAIIMSVQFVSKSLAGTSAEFTIPLYAECDYSTPALAVSAGSTQAVGIAQTTGIMATFPADAFTFVDSVTGLSLDSGSLTSFLNGLTLTGTPVDFDTAMSSVECIIMDTDGNPYEFYASQTVDFANGAPIDIASYQCGVSFL